MLEWYRLISFLPDMGRCFVLFQLFLFWAAHGLAHGDAAYISVTAQRCPASCHTAFEMQAILHGHSGG